MRILVGLDNSEVAERAAVLAGKWAMSLPLEVHLLTIVHPEEVHGMTERQSFAETLRPEGSDPGQTPTVAPGHVGTVGSVPGDPAPLTVEDRGQALSKARSNSEDYLRRMATRHLADLDVTIHVEFADKTAEAIVDFAEKLGADGIVLATHGRGGVRRALLGSVAEQVVRRSRTPVILAGPLFATD